METENQNELSKSIFKKAIFNIRIEITLFVAVYCCD